MLSSSEGLFRKRFGPQERTILEMGALVFFAKERIRAQDLDQNTRNYANEALAAAQSPLEQLLHLYLLNRGVLVTPFHNMMLVSPATTRRAELASVA